VQALGPDNKRNFPAKAISELPVTAGEERKRRKSSSYLGVSWNKSKSSSQVRMTDPQTKRQQQIGSYDTEEDAARAYDYAAVQARGPETKRNFPGEADAEQPPPKRQR
jgi:EREBP-like factor